MNRDDGRFGVEEIKTILRRQIRANLGTNLFYGRLPSNVTVDVSFPDAARSLRSLGEGISDDLAEYAAACTEEALYETNQYLDLEDEDRRALRSLYRDTFHRLVSDDDLLGCLRDHHRGLSSCVEQLYPAGFPALLAESPVLGRVTCAEYSASTIESIYGFELRDLREPVLDIGCGRSAGLVAALSTLGKDVVGIDRAAESSRTDVLKTGWFDFEYESREWGTIFANMSFTNHMRYHLAHGTGRRGAFADTYGRICSALAEGGSFRYAPAVPEAELSLDADEFSVERRDSGAAGIATACVTRMARRKR